MDGNDKPVEKMMQLFLKVTGDEAPRLVMNPMGAPYPADLVLLPGCTVAPKDEYDERDAWEGCAKVADMCRAGQKSIDESMLADHLEDAYSIVEDLMTLMADDAKIGRKSIYALARRIRELLVLAGKFANVELELEEVE